LKDLKEIKWLLNSKQTEVGIPFNTNILRIALNRKEEKIAQVLVAEYQIAIDEQMIIRAVKTRQMNFLYCIWAFNKNYEFIGNEEGDSSD